MNDVIFTISYKYTTGYNVILSIYFISFYRTNHYILRLRAHGGLNASCYWAHYLIPWGYEPFWPFSEKWFYIFFYP